jgi:hypothetical protein
MRIKLDGGAAKLASVGPKTDNLPAKCDPIVIEKQVIHADQTLPFNLMCSI